MSDDEVVQLSPDSLEEYFRLGVVSVFRLSTGVDALLEIDPARDLLRLFVPATGGMPAVDDFERIKVDRVDGRGSTSRYRVLLDARDMHYAAYQLVESIVASLRDGDTLARAVNESIADMKDLLANRGRLTDEEETGLWGELLVLEHLVEMVGEEDAIESWLGPAASEHDFSLHGFEAEVKTTRGEGRRHYIGSDLQLEPSPERPLFIVSIQVTLAGAAHHARTLPRLIADLRERLATTSPRFESALHDLRYRDGDADLYQTNFQLRSLPRAYSIDANFPAVTRSRLGVNVPNLSLVSDLRYRVDVGGLSYAAIPAPLNNFCEVPH